MKKKPRELFDEELSRANRKGGRIPKFENSYWEGLLNLNRNHTMEDCKKVAKYIQDEYNVICTGIFIHRDKGYINERGVVEYNLHANLTFMTYLNGKQNWRQTHIAKKAEKMQTSVANILKMERGEKVVLPKMRRCKSKKK